jgi:UDP-GlcNAc3NAcA epimerase
MMKIVTVVGARPQFIKAAVLSDCLRRNTFHEVVVHTGQHYDDNMSAVFFHELGIPEPHYRLDVGSGPHGAQTARMLEGIESVLLKEAPDWVLIYGDTNSTLAGALAASKLKIPIAHVEAGMRAFDSEPEEINRVIADHLSNLLFAPCDSARSNLLREGIPSERIHITGDIMADAAVIYGEKAQKCSAILEKLGLRDKEYVLATVHREQNTSQAGRLTIILGALIDLAKSLPVVLPLHPRTRLSLARGQLLHRAEADLNLIPPVGYLDMIMLEKHARVIATDSGGVQKESFYYGVPCVTLRECTEWTELVDLGWNRLVSPLNRKEIVRTVMKSLHNQPKPAPTPYGDGFTSKKITKLLLATDLHTSIQTELLTAMHPAQQQ